MSNLSPKYSTQNVCWIYSSDINMETCNNNHTTDNVIQSILNNIKIAIYLIITEHADLKMQNLFI